MSKRSTGGFGPAVRLPMLGEGPTPACRVTAVELKIARNWDTKTAKNREIRVDQGIMEIEVYELFKYENRENVLNRGLTLHAC